jgi:WD40 repeat protein
MALTGASKAGCRRLGRSWGSLFMLALAMSLAVSCQVWPGSHSGDDSYPHIEKPEQFIFEGWAETVAFMQGGNALAIGGCLDPDSDGDAPCSHGLVEVWSLKEPRQRSAFRFPREVTALAVSPDGSKWVAGDADGRLILSTAPSKVSRKLFHQKKKITALAFSPDGKWVASGSLDSAFPLGFMDPASGGMLRIKTPFEPVSALAFSPDGNDLAVGTIKGQVMLWNYAARVMPVQISSGSSESHAIGSIAFSPDSRLLAYGREDGNTVIVDRSAGQELMKFKAGFGVSAIAFSPDNRHLAIAQENGQILILEPHSSHPLWSKRHVLPVSDLAYSPDGASLGVATQRYVYVYRIQGPVSAKLSSDRPQ